MPVSPVFVYSNRDSSENTTANKAKLGVKIQKYHADNGALNTGSVALVLNIKTGYISPQFHIVFDDDFTTTFTRITQKIPDNRDNLFNDNFELTTEEFQLSIGKQSKPLTDRSEGDHPLNNNLPIDRSEGDCNVNNNSPTDHS